LCYVLDHEQQFESYLKLSYEIKLLVITSGKKRDNMDIFKLLNDCIEKPYRAHFLNREYNHHVYAKAPALAYSFHELGDEASLMGSAAILPD
jgi:hypothetical protein